MGPTGLPPLPFDEDDPRLSRPVVRPASRPEPKEPPAPGRWLPGKPAPKVSRQVSLAALVGGVGYVAIKIALGTHGVLSAVLAAPFQILWMAPLMRAGLRNAPRPEDLRLLEDPDDPDVCLVALAILSDGRKVGEDRGIAWFEDGRLLFSGHRTSFAIGGEDVWPKAAQDAFRLGSQHGFPDEAVPLRAEGRKVVIVKPLARKSDVGQRQEIRFLKALYAFKRDPPASSGPRQWPPFEA